MDEKNSLSVSDIEISCAHFVHSADNSSKCQCLHGHNYYVTVIVAGPNQEDGMIIDAHNIKDLVNVLDHKTLIPMDLIQEEDSYGEYYSIKNPNNGKEYALPKEDVCVLDIPATTAEHLSKRIAEQIMSNYPSITECGVSFSETAKMRAYYEVKRDD